LAWHQFVEHLSCGIEPCVYDSAQCRLVIAVVIAMPSAIGFVAVKQSFRGQGWRGLPEIGHHPGTSTSIGAMACGAGTSHHLHVHASPGETYLTITFAAAGKINPLAITIETGR
jgi:hypothetical protein